MSFMLEVYHNKNAPDIGPGHGLLLLGGSYLFDRISTFSQTIS